MSAQGEVVAPLDEEQVHAIVRELVESGIESLTVSLINAFANPAHERAIKRIIHELYPDFPVTISTDVLPEFREYERTLTACMNSYVRPKVQGYVKNLADALKGYGVAGEINILRSDAGLMTTEMAQQNPIY
jgi:N-methylhydantoinase A